MSRHPFTLIAGLLCLQLITCLNHTADKKTPSSNAILASLKSVKPAEPKSGNLTSPSGAKTSEPTGVDSVNRTYSNSTAECFHNVTINGTHSIKGSHECVNGTANSSLVVNSTGSDGFWYRNYMKLKRYLDVQLARLRRNKHMEVLFPFLFGVCLGLLSLIVFYLLRCLCTPSCAYRICYYGCCCWCCRRKQKIRTMDKKKDVLGMEENNYLLVSNHQDSDSEV